MKFFHALMLLLFVTNIFSLEQDSIAVSKHTKKNFKFAATEVVGIDLGVWSMDRYAFKQDWAKISIKSVKHNFESGFVFDDSDFLMNQFLHPYNGNLYFNTARTNGFSFWESAPFAFTGSMIWELFMEIEEPSNNDLITTTLGGMMLGEITFRVSSLLLDDSATGFERTWREISAAMINPVRGINRLVKGQYRYVSKHNLQEWKPVTGIISFGGNNVGEGMNLENGTQTPLLKMQFIYGSPFLKEEFRKPFEYFNLHLGINLSKENTISNFFGQALLYGKNFNFQGNLDDIQQDNLVGVFQHFDYLANATYEISASGFGGGVISRFSAYEGMELFTSAHISGIVLGGSNSIHAEGAGRDYNLGPGFSTKLESWLINKKYGEFYLGYSNYFLYTISGADGSETITITNARMETPISKRFRIGIEYLYYTRNGIYDNYEDITVENNELRSFLSYRL